MDYEQIILQFPCVSYGCQGCATCYGGLGVHHPDYKGELEVWSMQSFFDPAPTDLIYIKQPQFVIDGHVQVTIFNVSFRTEELEALFAQIRHIYNFKKDTNYEPELFGKIILSNLKGDQYTLECASYNSIGFGELGDDRDEITLEIGYKQKC